MQSLSLSLFSKFQSILLQGRFLRRLILHESLAKKLPDNQGVTCLQTRDNCWVDVLSTACQTIQNRQTSPVDFQAYSLLTKHRFD
jgi:hypothetical protein